MANINVAEKCNVANESYHLCLRIINVSMAIDISININNGILALLSAKNI
jgi:hypothetical protein